MNSVLSLVYFKTGFILDLQPGSHFRWVYELGLRFATRVTFQNRVHKPTIKLSCFTLQTHYILREALSGTFKDMFFLVAGKLVYYFSHLLSDGMYISLF